MHVHVHTTTHQGSVLSGHLRHGPGKHTTADGDVYDGKYTSKQGAGLNS
jgi:hypothetical protein